MSVTELKVTMRDVWNREPTIKPHTGPRQSLLPKTHLKQVLLHDNQYEQACLRNELQHLSLQQKWSSKILNVQKKSFVVRQLYQQQRLRLAGLGHMKLIPNAVEKTHRDVAKFRSRHNGVKDLKPYQHLKTGEIQQAQDALFTNPPRDTIPEPSRNKCAASKQDKGLGMNRIKDRDFHQNEHGKSPTAVVDHVWQSHSQMQMEKSLRQMNLEGSHEDLDYVKGSYYSDASDDDSDSNGGKSSNKDVELWLPTLNARCGGLIKSASPSQSKSISRQTTDNTITTTDKPSSNLKLPSIHPPPQSSNSKTDR